MSSTKKAKSNNAFVSRSVRFDARVRESFARQQAMHALGITIAHIAPGEVDLHLPFNANFTQQHGFMHAGIISTALDSACGYAAFSLMADDAAVLTVEFKINLLAPARGDNFILRGRVLKPGRTLSVCLGEAWARTSNDRHDGDGDKNQGGEILVAQMNATMMAVTNRDDVRG